MKKSVILFVLVVFAILVGGLSYYIGGPWEGFYQDADFMIMGNKKNFSGAILTCRQPQSEGILHLINHSTMHKGEIDLLESNIEPDWENYDYETEEECDWQIDAVGRTLGNNVIFSWSPTPKSVFFDMKFAVYLEDEEKMYLSDNISFKNSISDYSVNLLPNGQIEVNEITKFESTDFMRNVLFEIPFWLVLSVLLFVKLYISNKIIAGESGNEAFKKVRISIIISYFLSILYIWLVIPTLIYFISVYHFTWEIYNTFKFSVFDTAGVIILFFIFDYILIYLFNKKIIKCKKLFRINLLTGLVLWMLLFIIYKIYLGGVYLF